MKGAAPSRPARSVESLIIITINIGVFVRYHRPVYRLNHQRPLFCCPSLHIVEASRRIIGIAGRRELAKAANAKSSIGGNAFGPRRDILSTSPPLTCLKRASSALKQAASKSESILSLEAISCGGRLKRRCSSIRPFASQLSYRRK